MRRIGAIEVDDTTDGYGLTMMVRAFDPIVVDTPEGGEDVAGARGRLDRHEVEQLRDACDDFLEGRRL